MCATINKLCVIRYICKRTLILLLIIIFYCSDDFPPASPLIKDVQCNDIYPHILRCQYMLVTDIMEDICDDSCGIPNITCSKF